MARQIVGIRDRDGLHGVVAEEMDPEQTLPMQVLVRLDTGTLVSVPAGMLVPQNDNSFFLPLRFADMERAMTGEQVVVPVVAEELDVRRQRVNTGVVRLTKRVHEREEIVDEPLLREEVAVERVSVNEFVEEAPAPRYEGETLVVPLLEEVIVVQKRLILKEELRITKRRTEFHQPQQVVLRREEIVVERSDSGS
jgi:uncharacterized protein (TIGR02271 family)